MENPIKEVVVVRKATIRWGDDLHTIELHERIDVTDAEHLDERINGVIKNMRDKINDEELWFNKKYEPSEQKTEPVLRPPKREAPQRQMPPSTEPISLGRKNYLNDLMKKSTIYEEKIMAWLQKFGKNKIDDLTNQEASQILDDIVGPRKK